MNRADRACRGTNPGRARSWFRELANAAGIATVLAIYVRTFVVLPLHIPSESMVPALLPGDHIVVDRLAPFSSRLLPPTRPRRGDVVVLQAPNRPGELVVKRCVGFAGERIERRAGRLLVNGREVEADWAMRPGADFPPTLVEPDRYFVLGDQPSRSIDSRRWGTIDRRNCLGRAVFIYWSTDSPAHHGWDRLASSLARRLSSTRWGRILRPVR